MSNNLFRKMPLRQRSLFQKLFKQYPEENAVIELNNLLALQPIRSITPGDVVAIEQRNGISLAKEFPLNLEEFYAVVFNAAFRNYTLSDEDAKNLTHLKNILYLDDSSVAHLHEKTGIPIYSKAVVKVISNGAVSPDERSFLSKLRTDLRLPDAVARKIWEQACAAYLEACVKKIIASQSFPPAMQEELKEKAANLGVPLSLSADQGEQLARLKLYWDIEHGPLPVAEADINLQKSEVCYFRAANVGWCELRAVRNRGQSTQMWQTIDLSLIHI